MWRRIDIPICMMSDRQSLQSGLDQANRIEIITRVTNIKSFDSETLQIIAHLNFCARADGEIMNTVVCGET